MRRIALDGPPAEPIQTPNSHIDRDRCRNPRWSTRRCDGRCHVDANPYRDHESMLPVFGLFGLAPIFGALGYWSVVGMYLQRHPSAATAFVAGLISPIGIVVFSGGFSLLFVFYSVGFVLVPGIVSGAIVGCLFEARPNAGSCACGYNLTGNVSGRCRECGTVVRATGEGTIDIRSDAGEREAGDERPSSGPLRDVR